MKPFERDRRPSQREGSCESPSARDLVKFEGDPVPLAGLQHQSVQRVGVPQAGQEALGVCRADFGRYDASSWMETAETCLGGVDITSWGSVGGMGAACGRVVQVEARQVHRTFAGLGLKHDLLRWLWCARAAEAQEPEDHSSDTITSSSTEESE